MPKFKRHRRFAYLGAKTSKLRIAHPRTLGVGVVVCAGLLGVTQTAFTQDPPPPAAAAPEVKTEAKPAAENATDATANIEIPNLTGADDKAIESEWEQLQQQLEEVEVTQPEKAIRLYEQFMNQGGTRNADVAMEAVLRLGGLYSLDLQRYESAIKIYEWALQTYPFHRSADAVQEANLKAQGKLRGEDWRTRKIPVVGIQSAEPDKTPIEPVKVGANLPQFPSALAQAEPEKIIGAPSIGPAVIPIQASGGASPQIVGAGGPNLLAPSQPNLGTGEISLPGQALTPLVGINAARNDRSHVLSHVNIDPHAIRAASQPGNYQDWQPGPERCVTALARQKNGQLWVATEDSGVWCLEESKPARAGITSTSTGFTPAPSRWRQFTSKDGLGDDSAYALAVDSKDRVWVGTLNHGVSVWNGKAWKNYGVLEGPLGERVFDIAVCPTDGDVWIATNAGLTRYSQSKDSWSYLTKADGLPSDQIQAIAFDKQGNLIVGTQCDGLGLASVADNYKQWRVLRGPEQMPTTPTGTGLPTSLINDVLVSQDNTIYVATTLGLAWSADAGANWSYVRGRDYANKVRGLYNGPPAGWAEQTGAILAEDYVSCLAEDSFGHLLLGHWKEGYEELERRSTVGTSKSLPVGLNSAAIKTDQALKVIWQENSGVVKAILATSSLAPLVARYDEGISSVSQINTTAAKEIVGSDIKSKNVQAIDTSVGLSFPKAAEPPTLTQLQDVLTRIKNLKDSVNDSDGAYSGEDWTTQGDWIDRYGNFSCVLSNMGGGGSDLINGYRASWFESRAWIGRNRTEDDFLRYWVQSIHTDNLRSLQHPNLGGRKQTEWDDHGEAYPMEKDGPHVYATVKVPKGQYILSCYFFNKDGKTDNNRLRDYLVEVKATPMDYSVYDRLGASNRNAEALFEASPLAARARVLDFAGGVYKRFYINASQNEYFTVRIKRNNSFNTIISGIFLDPVGQLCGPQGPLDQPAQVREQRFANVEALPESEGEACLRIMDRLLYLRDTNPFWYSTQNRNYLLPLLRTLLKNEGESNLAERLEKAGSYENLREDVAICLNDAQMFDRRDRVYFSPKSYQSYVWDEMSVLGQKSNWDFESYMTKWQWSDENMSAFVARHQAKQSWQ